MKTEFTYCVDWRLKQLAVKYCLESASTTKLRGAAASCRTPLKRPVGLVFKSHPVIHFPVTP